MLLANALGILSFVSPHEDIRAKALTVRLDIINFFTEQISTNAAVYQAFKAYAQGNALKETLRADERYFIANSLNDFKRYGLDLPEEKRLEFVEIIKKMSDLAQIFEKNIADDNGTITVTRKELAGLEDDFIQNLKSKESDDSYILGMDYPTYFNVIENCTIASTREKINEAFNNRAYPINVPVLKEFIALVSKLANSRFSGSYAHLNLDDSMAHKPEIAERFLYDLLAKVKIKTAQRMSCFLLNYLKGSTWTRWQDTQMGSTICHKNVRQKSF